MLLTKPTTSDTGGPPATGTEKSIAKSIAKSLARNGLPVGLLVLMVVLVGAPIIALGYGAIRSGSFGDPNAHFTLDALANTYGSLFGGGLIQQATFNSILLALPSTVMATLLGSVLAWVIARTNVPGRRIFHTLFIIPMFFSGVLTIIAWTILAAPRAGWINYYWTQITGGDDIVNIYSYEGMVWVLGLLFMPYAFLFTYGLFRSGDPEQEEAAAMSGAGLWRRLRTVTFPVVWPGIAAAALFIFILALENFAVPEYLGRQIGYTTLPSDIYESIRQYPVRPAIGAAEGTILIALSLIGLWYYRRISKRADRYTTVGGKGKRATDIRLSRFAKVLIVAFCSVFALVGTILPTGAVILRALMHERSIGLQWEALSFEFIGEMIGDPKIQSSIQNSVMLAIGTAIVVCIVGLLMAFTTIRAKRPLIPAITDYLAAVPIGIPGIVFGLGLLWVFVATPLYGSLASLLIALIALHIVYGARMFGAGMMQIDKGLGEASRIAGATPLRSLRDVNLPLLRGTAVSVWIIVFLLVMREVSTSIMLFGINSRTLPVFSWIYLDDGFYGQASALAVIQVVISGVVILIFRATFGKDVKLSSSLPR